MSTRLIKKIELLSFNRRIDRTIAEKVNKHFNHNMNDKKTVTEISNFVNES